MNTRQWIADNEYQIIWIPDNGYQKYLISDNRQWIPDNKFSRNTSNEFSRSDNGYQKFLTGNDSYEVGDLPEAKTTNSGGRRRPTRRRVGSKVAARGAREGAWRRQRVAGNGGSGGRSIVSAVVVAVGLFGAFWCADLSEIVNRNRNKTEAVYISFQNRSEC